jgi:hypothetical protein
MSTGLRATVAQCRAAIPSRHLPATSANGDSIAGK